jgi:hypothetical protein
VAVASYSPPPERADESARAALRAVARFARRRGQYNLGLIALRGPERPEPATPGAAPRAGEDARTHAGRPLRCARCGHPVTDGASRIAVDGAHEHVRTNPGGFTHRFGCFAAAPGCVSVGVPSRQATWFPPRFWHVQACGGCGEHLGWLFFVQADDGFFGLILDALVEDARPEPPSRSAA